ncbi:MAG: CBS domain-containing protein [Candidatus Thermoplasmatota archaeon]
MKNKLVDEFYHLKVKQLMNKRIWDTPIIEENEDIFSVLNILGARNHIWVVNNKQEKKLVGAITEHDILVTLAPKSFSPYTFGLPDIRSLQHETVKTARDIMSTEVISCTEDEKIIDILQRMTRYKLRRLPVVRNNQIIGEITLNQLIRKFYDATQYHSITEEG